MSCLFFWGNQNKAFLPEVPQLPGCMANSATFEETLANAQEVITYDLCCSLMKRRRDFDIKYRLGRDTSGENK
jgi:hypothetical protein